MASSSPESPSKKRKHHKTRRDPPLFASRRSRPTLQQPPEFLTESINTSRNTSYIPSPVPSPDKSPTRDSLRARPRQAINRKGLARTSSYTTPRTSDENLRPHSSRSLSRTSRGKHDSKPTSAHAASQSQSQSAARPEIPTKAPTPTRTPSPPRGRSIVVESPGNSESSPGRGYAEAYQRIVEEENLAQEDSIDDLEINDTTNSDEDLPQQPGRLQVRHRHTSASPRSLRTLRKASPRASTMNETTTEETDEEHEATDQDSASGLASIENETQTSAGSGSSQYARDIQRLNNALKGNGQAFSRARVRQKARSATQTLRRSNGSDESLGSAFSSGSLSHQGSDPSVNIPKAWGRKAKPGRDWLNRINSQSGRFTGDAPKGNPSGDQLIVHSETRSSQQPIEHGVAEADSPGVRSSSRVNGSSSGSTPRTTLQRNISSERKSQWVLNEDEFTGRSLQVSESPPMRIRNATRDSLQNQVIGNFGSAALADENAEKTREQDQNSHLLPFEIERNLAGESPSKKSYIGRSGSETAKGQDWQKENCMSGQPEASEVLGEATPDSIHEEIGEPIPDTPIVVFRKSEDQKPSSGKVKDHAGQSESLLRRLARVSSQSPSPAKELDDANALSGKGDNKSKNEQTPHQSKPMLNQKTPVVTGAWIEQTPGPTPQTVASKAILNTPFVTGGWIETPLPTGGRGPPMPTPSDPENAQELGSNNVGASDLITKLNTTTPRSQLRSQEPLKYTGPPLPKSALEEIINDARSGKFKDTRPDLDSAEEPTLNLGESTIQSLEDLIANDTDYSTLLATSQETSPPSSDPSPSCSKENHNQPEETQDPQSYTNLLSRLRTLGPSIRASTRQLASLERTVTTTASVASAANSKTTQRRPSTADDLECHEAGEFHDFIWPCPRCNCPGRPSDTTRNSSALIPTTTVTLSVPRLWHFPPHSRLPRLTTLGALALALYTYLFLENWAQMTFCHPRYAHTTVGYGVDIHAPQPPFVLFQVLYRKSGVGGWVEGAYVLGRTVVRVVVAVVGWVLGALMGGDAGDEVGGGAGGGKQPVSRDERIPRPRWGPDLSMFDDEYL